MFLPICRRNNRQKTKKPRGCIFLQFSQNLSMVAFSYRVSRGPAWRNGRHIHAVFRRRVLAGTMFPRNRTCRRCIAGEAVGSGRVKSKKCPIWGIHVHICGCNRRLQPRRQPFFAEPSSFTLGRCGFDVLGPRVWFEQTVKHTYILCVLSSTVWARSLLRI